MTLILRSSLDRRQVDCAFFGTNGEASFENLEQIVKIAQLRHLYQKAGMFWNPVTGLLNAGDRAHKGDQVRGTGFLHNGSSDTDGDGHGDLCEELAEVEPDSAP